MSHTVIIKENGPLIARGNIRVENSEGTLITEDNEVFLCRCGNSENKPFCDGAHKRYSFTDAAKIHDENAEAPVGDAPLVITVRPHAMLIAKGPMTIRNANGTSETTRNKAALCRCGHSENKPFCDASHKHCNF